jgi:hypothetical protein
MPALTTDVVRCMFLPPHLHHSSAKYVRIVVVLLLLAFGFVVYRLFSMCPAAILRIGIQDPIS